MKEILVSPVNRVQIAAGQIMSATTITVLQGIIILLAGYFIGMKYSSVITPFAIVVFMIFVGLVFSSLGLFLAASFKNSQTFQIVSVAITTPVTFL
ncbi:ABC transporter permease [Metabacillus fastidiosus]|uniref:ABC transporter permease n=1 Tax=Metabacillus fastidiosus TaxID=1458 RepID=UPI003D2CE01B